MINTLLQRLTELIRPERAQQLAKEHGWQKRKGKISAFEFLYSGLGQGSAIELTLNAQASSLSQAVSRQAIDQRYTPEAVDFFKSAFQATLASTLTWQTQSAMTQLLQKRFAAVRLFDSTRCPCSDALASLFPASGGAGTEAGVKLLLAYDYSTGQIQPLELLPAKRSDQGLTERVVQQLRPGELGLWDKGFYKAAALRPLIQRGAYFVTPWSQGVSVSAWNPKQQRFEALDVAAVLKAASTQSGVEWPGVQLGETPETQLGPLRLIAYPLREEAANRRRAQLREKCRTHGRVLTEKALELAGWLILVTNVPPNLLPTTAVGFLYRVRWQVELIFKQFKSVLRLDVLPSGNPSRVQCEIWGRLLMAVLTFVWSQHLNAASFKLHECEISFAKVAKLLQQQGHSLVAVLFGDRVRLQSEYRKLWNKLLKLARKERQPSRPTTWENLCAHLLNVPLS
jgi:hypothetical protein